MEGVVSEDDVIVAVIGVIVVVIAVSITIVNLILDKKLLFLFRSS